MVDEHSVREARLRPEFADLYPALTPGKWEPATTIGARILMWQLRQPGPVDLGDRLLNGLHFEFRGGAPAGRSRDGARTRREDFPARSLGERPGPKEP